MKVLLTGIDGYIGCLLAEMLQNRGHEVVGLDTGYYTNGLLYEDMSIKNQPQVIKKDIRAITVTDLIGFDAVLHLAELSNDPLGENNPEITFDINHRGSVELAKNAKIAGVSRFVYTSSCSVYGCGTEEILTEESATNPQTAYAKCKVMVERDVAELASDNFSPCYLRNATAYGASPRMRFDIVLNNLAGLAWTTKKIAMTSDGSPWRPLVHVLDICNAIVASVEAPRENIHNQVFNVGHNEDNYQVRDIANIIGDTFTDCEVSFGDSSADNRSYRVNFDKIHNALPNFECEWNAVKGAQQLHEIFSTISMTKEMFEYRAYTRIKNLQHLIKTHQIDANFNWSSRGAS